MTSTPVYYQSSFPLSFTEKKKCITLRWVSSIYLYLSSKLIDFFFFFFAAVTNIISWSRSLQVEIRYVLDQKIDWYPANTLALARVLGMAFQCLDPHKGTRPSMKKAVRFCGKFIKIIESSSTEGFEILLYAFIQII